MRIYMNHDTRESSDTRSLRLSRLGLSDIGHTTGYMIQYSTLSCLNSLHITDHTPHRHTRAGARRARDGAPLGLAVLGGRRRSRLPRRGLGTGPVGLTCVTLRRGRGLEGLDIDYNLYNLHVDPRSAISAHALSTDAALQSAAHRASRFVPERRSTRVSSRQSVTLWRPTSKPRKRQVPRREVCRSAVCLRPCR